MKNTIILLLLVMGLLHTSPLAYAQGEVSEQYDELLEKAENEGTVMVIVDLNLPTSFQPEGEIEGQDAINMQRERIASRQQELLDSLRGDYVEVYAVYETIPAMALKVDKKALRTLIDSTLVKTIQEDVPFALGSSTSVNVTDAHSRGSISKPRIQVDVPVGGGGGGSNLLTNPSFETGSTVPWQWLEFGT